MKSQNLPKWMPAMYVAYFGILQELANHHGYALCVHGSVIRDFDLIAVPFDVEVRPHEDLLLAIRKAIGLEESSNKIFDIVGHEPHGRTCYTIECGGDGYFDISFTPTMQQAINKIKLDAKRDNELREILNQ
jgi:hypothetical protein